MSKISTFLNEHGFKLVEGCTNMYIQKEMGIVLSARVEGSPVATVRVSRHNERIWIRYNWSTGPANVWKMIERDFGTLPEKLDIYEWDPEATSADIENEFSNALDFLSAKGAQYIEGKSSTIEFQKRLGKYTILNLFAASAFSFNGTTVAYSKVKAFYNDHIQGTL